jgi:hypothetical protein
VGRRVDRLCLREKQKKAQEKNRKGEEKMGGLPWANGLNSAWAARGKIENAFAISFKQI